MPLTLAEARRTVRERRAGLHDHIRAVSTLAADDDHATIDDLLDAIELGGVPARLAACALYRRTGRRPTPVCPDDYEIDPDAWRAFLGERRPVKKSEIGDQSSGPVGSSSKAGPIVLGVAGAGAFAVAPIAFMAGSWIIATGCAVVANALLACAALRWQRRKTGE